MEKDYRKEEQNRMEKKKSFFKYSLEDKALLLVGYILLGLFVLAILVPMIYIVIASFMDPITLMDINSV